jgi:hypothetical protein
MVVQSQVGRRLRSFSGSPTIRVVHNLESHKEDAMIIRHPFAWISGSTRRRLLWTMSAIAIVVLVAMSIAGARLTTVASPAGIISFEFAGSIGKASCMMASWETNGPAVAAFSLGLDYLFLLAYSVAISLGCVLISGAAFNDAGAGAWIGMVLAWAQFVAAALDAVENYGLMRVVLGAQDEIWPALARACAIPKFLIVLAGLLYLIVALIILAIRKLGEK